MPAHYGNLQEQFSIDFLYTKQGFERTRTYIQLGGCSFVGCPCYYCGDLATCDDHVYPVVALRSLYGLTDLPPARLMVIVPACQECNGVLGDEVFPSLISRKNYLKKRLRRRHKRLLALPTWHPQELNDLGPGLREYVELGFLQQEHLKKRLAW